MTPHNFCGAWRFINSTSMESDDRLLHVYIYRAYSFKLGYAPPHCRTSQYHMTFIILSESNDLADPQVLRGKANDFLLAMQSNSHILCLLLFFPFSSFFV